MNTTRIQLDLTDAQIEQLRVVIDGLALNPYVNLVVTVLKALPLESVAVTSLGADADPAPVRSREPGSFSLHAFTPKGNAGLQHIEAVLGTLEVVENDVCLHVQRYCESCAHTFGDKWLDPQDERLSRLPHGSGEL